MGGAVVASLKALVQPVPALVDLMGATEEGEDLDHRKIPLSDNRKTTPPLVRNLR
jgi:hypothetical protein